MAQLQRGLSNGSGEEIEEDSAVGIKEEDEKICPSGCEDSSDCENEGFISNKNSHDFRITVILEKTFFMQALCLRQKRSLRGDIIVLLVKRAPARVPLVCNQNERHADANNVGQQIFPARRTATADLVINFFDEADSERTARRDLSAPGGVHVKLLVQKIKLRGDQSRARDGVVKFIFAEPVVMWRFPGREPA